MAFFGKKSSPWEEVRKAYESLSDDDKMSFRQSIADSVQGSIAAQEGEHGQEDGQNAEAREGEAFGEERAESKDGAEDRCEKDDIAAEEVEDKKDKAREEIEEKSRNASESDVEALREEIAKLAARLDLVERTPQRVDQTTADKLNSLETRYNN